MAATSTATRRPHRSNDEWDKLALEVIVPRLKAGTTMTAIRAEFGAGATIRRALMRIGYDTKGRPATVAKTAGSNPKVLAKRVAARREQGASWDRLTMETGKAADELKALLAKHGHGTLASGRVVVSERGKRKAEKAAAPAVKPAPVKRTRKAKATPVAKQATTPRTKRVKV